MKSKLGYTLAGIYIVVAVSLIVTQGLFGESFIAIILGLPWTLFLALIEFGNVTGAILYLAIITPMIINALLLYFIGTRIQKLFRFQSTRE